MLLNNKIDKIKIIPFVLFIMVVLMSTSSFFQLGGIPIFMLFWFILICYILLREKPQDKTTLDIIKENTRTRIITILVIWLLYAMFQFLLFAYNWAGARYFTLILINITTFIIIIDIAKSINVIRLLNKAILCGLFINLVVAFWEISTDSHIKILSSDYERRFKSIPVTFFSNANDFATFLFCSVVILMFEKVMSKSKKYHLLIYTLLGATIYILIQTDSRGGLNGTLLFLAIYILLRTIGKVSKGKKSIMGIFSILMFTSSIMLLLLLIIENYTSSIVDMFFEYTDGRLDLWEQAFDLFINSFLLGIGPGQSLVKMNGNVHFLLLEIVTEYGVFVVVGLLVIIYKLIKLIFPFLNSKINTLITSFLITFIPVSVSSSSMTKIYPVWIIIGIVFAIKVNHCDKNLDS